MVAGLAREGPKLSDIVGRLVIDKERPENLLPVETMHPTQSSLSGVVGEVAKMSTTASTPHKRTLPSGAAEIGDRYRK
jgi:hypothetical protein